MVALELDAAEFVRVHGRRDVVAVDAQGLELLDFRAVRVDIDEYRSFPLAAFNDSVFTEGKFFKHGFPPCPGPRAPTCDCAVQNAAVQVIY